jgi:hypothetical protein
MATKYCDMLLFRCDIIYVVAALVVNQDFRRRQSDPRAGKLRHDHHATHFMSGFEESEFDELSSIPLYLTKMRKPVERQRDDMV